MQLSKCGTGRDIACSFCRKIIENIIEVSLPQGFERIPVAADGFFSLGSRERRAHYFLEADRGSMPIKRFTAKIIGFRAWRRENRHTEKLRIKDFRVLTITSSQTRLANLVTAARALEDAEDEKEKAMFLFTTEDHLQLDAPGKIFENIWTSVAGDEPCSIL